jgi:hypothetical protein
VKVSHYEPRLIALVGLLGSSFSLSFGKTQALSDPGAGRLPLDLPGDTWIEPTNNAAERALRQSVLQRKISNSGEFRQGTIYPSRMPTDATILRQQGRDVGQFLEQAWIIHHRSRLMSSLLPDP